ncbi:hypothetical protein D3C71_2208690 [compost metagenome]
MEAIAEEMAEVTEGADPEMKNRAGAMLVAVRRAPGMEELLSAAVLPGSVCVMPMA